ncbi:CSEP0039 effector protein [Colletotrichum scovillei]|uniref:CSEP0039 effector protein n=2 Tax=Colletotrichum scovillei TaxID=1209932 RepID=A0A9P7RK65_9PEZI|nr:CSEP0039 effector protein [Colletotrichum scovillei]KAG7076577.1 CSEP0039 effector protein [Colletotrichum scovillei]KAG7083689.1 CSEP0039 effector protein [Colletotrichum scovillei]
MKAKFSCFFSDLFFYFFFSCARLVSCLFSVFFSLFFKTFKSSLQFFRWSCPYYTTLRLLFSVTVPQTTLRLFFQEPFYPNHTKTYRLPEQIDKMVNRYIFAVAGLAAQLNALPLNINLGAYSPALVVGDGEISFGGRNDVSQLMNVLEGAAVNAAQGAANAPAAAPAAPAAPATPAAAPQQPAQQAAASVGGATPVTASSADNQINEAQAIAALQGMGKEIAPRVQLTKARPAEKRDLSGFDRALKYAEVALTKGPKVQLGTGKEGSGVGMIVDNNQQAAARPGTGGAAEAAPATPAAPRPAGAIVAQQKVKARSDEAQQPPRRRAKVTTMYVRSGVPAGVEMTPEKLVARDPSVPVSQVVPATNNNVVKRAVEELNSRGVSGGAIDTVNLNVSGEGVTMTFVETQADDVEDEQ